MLAGFKTIDRFRRAWLPVVALAAVLAAGCGGGGSSRSAAFQPPAVADAGPALRISESELEQALHCSAELSNISRDPVLLVPAFSTAEESFGWNYLRQLPALGIPTCSLSLPDGGFGDLQRAAEYVVRAVRRMSAASHSKVIVFGHQHGPLAGLWALTFWPDMPGRVSSLISLATPYQGTTRARTACQLAGRCPPSAWQIATGSNFLAALNARPLPAGPAYTSIATRYDELITPQPRASHLDGATNIVLQNICPGRPVEHFSILADYLAYQLVLDAIQHPGEPAHVRHLPANVCSRLFMPATRQPASAISALRGLAGFLIGSVGAVVTQSVPAEPALRDYVDAVE